MSKEQISKASGGVCSAKGFLAGSIYCGIKAANKNKPDVAIVFSKEPAVAAATFTTNSVAAPPVLVSRQHMAKRMHCGVILNSGNANACTGEPGIEVAKTMARECATVLGCALEEVLVCSTGRIGVPLPIEKVSAKIPDLIQKASRGGGTAAARAIMTSDSVCKQVAYEVRTSHGKFYIGGMAKGAGMINPNMATMLCVLTTDAAIEKKFLQRLLSEAVEDSFNRITVDGDMSTNDTVICLANGQSGVSINASNSGEAELFSAVLRQVCVELARMIVADGEGTTRVIELEVRKAKTVADARKAAETVANSILLKCAWAGGDPNWGRILDALGYSGVEINPNTIDVYYDDLLLVQDGMRASFELAAVKRIANRKEFRVTIDLNLGKASHTLLTTDLTEEFVRLNLSE